jgi:hypothetical protein
LAAEGAARGDLAAGEAGADGTGHEGSDGILDNGPLFCVRHGNLPVDALARQWTLPGGGDGTK